MARRLLVPWRDQLNLTAQIIKRIQEADVAVSANTENVRNLFADKELRDELTTLPIRHDALPSV